MQPFSTPSFGPAANATPPGRFPAAPGGLQRGSPSRPAAVRPGFSSPPGSYFRRPHQSSPVTAEALRTRPAHMKKAES